MKSKEKGFTLIELLVVVSIIGLMSSVTIVTFNKSRSKARDTRTIEDFKALDKALHLYYSDNGTFPAPGGVLMSTTSSWNFLSTALIAYMPAAPKPLKGDRFGYRYIGGPGVYGISSGSNCLQVTNGFVLFTALENYSNPILTSDGGINPISYEVFDGDKVRIYTASPGC